MPFFDTFLLNRWTHIFCSSADVAISSISFAACASSFTEETDNDTLTLTTIDRLRREIIWGNRHGHIPIQLQQCKKKLGVAMLVVTIWLELCMSYSSSHLHHVHYLCSNEIQNGVVLVPAYPGCAGKWLLNECCCCCIITAACSMQLPWSCMVKFTPSTSLVLFLHCSDTG